jgi:hypothetical protein
MEVNADAIINGLLDEIKRLTLDNVALKAMLIGDNHNASTNDEIES